MPIELDPVSDVPLYQQLRDGIVAEIASGHLRAGDRLGAVRRVAESFRINPATVAKAYDLLQREGLITINRKSGSVVARDLRSGRPSEDFAGPWKEKVQGLLLEALAQGMSLEEASAELRSALDGLRARLSSENELRGESE
ncbi:GntR family transcriptional regulator [Sinomonas sp. P47F7]|uniref:GntR family transcriptional regulator n=1 Tax=Sinomonas sp. P47F7 TaxID=3410987 RepID=UPI003BF60B7C